MNATINAWERKLISVCVCVGGGQQLSKSMPLIPPKHAYKIHFLHTCHEQNGFDKPLNVS